MHSQPGQEGPGALYKGWLPSVIGVIPYVGLNFAVYESLKASLLKTYGEKNSVMVRMGITHQPHDFPQYDITIKWLAFGVALHVCMACLGVQSINIGIIFPVRSEG